MKSLRFCFFATLFFLFTGVGLNPTLAAETWIQKARKVGQSEIPAARDNAISSLRKQKNLSAKLLKALDGSTRSLALDAISALGLKELAPELQKRVASDRDGFLVLTLSSMLDKDNKDSILKTYVDTLSGDLKTISPATIVAILEPLGRLGQTIDKTPLTHLANHSYPEVRASLLYYLRAMAILHSRTDHNDLILKLLNASEFQLRLQAISIAKEIGSQSGSKPFISTQELEKRCQKERPTKLKDQCLLFVRGGQT